MTLPVNTTAPKGRAETQKSLRGYALMILALLALAALATHFFGNDHAGRNSEPVVREFLIFHTYGRVTLWEPAGPAHAAVDEMIGELQALEKVINTYRQDSEIAHLNATAHEAPFHCSDTLWDIIQASRTAYQLSDGAFDISVGPLMKLWGFYETRQSLPSEEEISRARNLVGLGKIVFDAELKTVAFPAEGMFLDFGGIAKGYAIDMCRSIADRHGLTCGMIDLGGNIACLASPPVGKSTYTVGIRDPANREQIMETVELRDMCIATSGNYEKCFRLEGRLVHHIVDPETGWPVPSMASVTVAAPKGLASDVFSTAIFVRGENMALKLLDHEPTARVLTVSANPESPAEKQIKRYNWRGDKPE